MEKKTRKQYLPPQIDVIPMETEGSMMIASGGVPPLDPGGNWGTSTSRTRQYNTASDSDLEDLINDILTVEQ